MHIVNTVKTPNEPIAQPPKRLYPCIKLSFITTVYRGPNSRKGYLVRFAIIIAQISVKPYKAPARVD